MQFYENTIMGDFSSPIDAARIQVGLAEPRFTAKTSVLVSIGNGAGSEATFVANQLSLGTVVVLDISVRALQAARNSGQLPLIADAEGPKLPLRTDSVDVVMLNEVIEHLVDTDSILGEIRRVLRPGGILMLSTPNLAAWFNRLALMFGIQPAFSETSQRQIFGRPGKTVVGHLRLFTSRALLQQLSTHGFSRISIVGVHAPFFGGIVRSIDKFLAHRHSLAGGLVVVCESS